jgi:prolyl-tRNA synthetase
MKLSQAFFYPQKTSPKDADSKNARYLAQAGFVSKNLSGVYAMLPFGLKVYRKIENLIREEMSKVGAQELLMNVLQDKNLWQKTGRWEEADDVFYKIKDKEKEIGLAPTHEEQITQIVKEKISSYKNLPVLLYQIQNKFRKEKRAKSGMLRLREFFMKDCYSFSSSLEEHEIIYEKLKESYFRFFEKLGLEAKLVIASGGMFAKFSHEFQVFCEIGEDDIYYCPNCQLAHNKEISELKEGDKCPNCGGIIEKRNAVEVGNIFTLKNKFSQPLEAGFLDKNGKRQDFLMGCYGVGLSRCLAMIVEIFYDEDKKKMIWPKSVTPFLIEVISIDQNEKATEIYQQLKILGLEVAFDDRDKRFGQKMSEADLLGCPYKVIVGKKALENQVEIRNEIENKVEFIEVDKLNDYFGKMN